MQAKDVMTTNVVTIPVDATIEDAAKAMLDNAVSGLPVVNDAGAVVGVISEGDLLHRQETGTERKRSWWLRAFTSTEQLTHEFITAHSHKVADVMSQNVITIPPDTELGEIAAELEEKRIKRLPVIDGGKLVGIVSRANLLHALASQAGVQAPARTVDDQSLRAAVAETLKDKEWASHGALNIIVNDGVVEIWGWVESEDERKALCLAAGEVPGVKEVLDRLGRVQPWLLGT